MALIKTESIQGFQNLPALRQVGLMVGLSASIALGIAIVLWSQTPNYSLLYGKLSAKDSGDVLESLQKAKIRYKLDTNTGSILVPAADIHNARMHLAKDDLPKGGGMGLEFLKKEESFRTSNSTRNRRYIHAKEIELARTISSIVNIESARIHLAVSARSQYIGRKTEAPKATVFLKIYGGGRLSYGQVKAISHMVSSSIPGMNSNQVSIIDQQGKLLSRVFTDKDTAMTEGQLDYKSRIEHALTKKVEDIITPLVGEGRVRAKIDIVLDLTRSEQTRESYNPDYPAISKEITIEKRSGLSTLSSGAPGAKANTPGHTGATGKPGSANVANANNGSSSRTVRKSMLPDKTISHIKKPGGTIRRLSIAVLVDDKRSVDDEGTVTKTPLTVKELSLIRSLVEGSVGYDAKRGDVINISNATFYTPPVPEALPEVPLLEQPWFWDVVKQAVGGIAVLLLIFAVLKPILKSLAEKGAQIPQGQLVQAGDEHQDPATSAQDGAAQLPPPDQNFEDKITFARNMVGQEPGRVAQVVRNWVQTDGGG